MPARSITLRRAAAAALMLLVVLTAAGCTARQSRDQYEERLQAAIEVRAKASQGVERGTFRTAEEWRAAATEVNEAADELDVDPPPKEAEEAHEVFLVGMENLAGLLGRYGRCAGLEQRQPEDARICKQKIDQTAFDSVRNDFTEADTIYRQIGYGLPGMSGEDGDEGGDTLDDGGNEGDEL